MMVIFEFLAIKLVVFKHLQKCNFFFHHLGGWKNELRFLQNNKNFKKIKNSFFYILQLPHAVISNSEKLTHPIVQPPNWTF